MISKELFIKAIDTIEKQFKHDEECSKAIKVLFEDGQGFYNYSEVLIVLEDILSNLFKDEANSWIQYFIYELEFGKKWTNTSITDNGKSVKLRNASELYDFLIK